VGLTVAARHQRGSGKGGITTVFPRQRRLW
jgi:hypothetical protein